MVITEFVDQVFTNGDTSNAVFLIVLYLGINLLRALFQYGYSLILDSASADVLANFRTVLYKKLQTLTPSFYSATRTGDIMMRLTGDLETMRHFVSWVMTNAIYAVIIFIAGLVVFFSTNAVLASILLVVSPFMAYLVLKMRNGVRTDVHLPAGNEQPPKRHGTGKYRRQPCGKGVRARKIRTGKV